MNDRRKEVVKQVLADTGTMYRGTLNKAFTGKASPRGAIKAMCLSCVGFLPKEVRACTGYTCPLWSYRPFQGSKDILEESSEGPTEAL